MEKGINLNKSDIDNLNAIIKLFSCVSIEGCVGDRGSLIVVRENK